jgi:hypothetical protein
VYGISRVFNIAECRYVTKIRLRSSCHSSGGSHITMAARSAMIFKMQCAWSICLLSELRVMACDERT